MNTAVPARGRARFRTIALAPEVRSGASQECFFALKDFALEFSRFTALARVEPTGKISCSSIAESVELTQEAQPFFRRAMRGRSFVVNRLMTGQLSGHPTVGLLYPVLGGDLDVEFLIYAGLELDWLSDVLEGTEAPPETELVILDSTGAVIPSGDGVSGGGGHSLHHKAHRSSDCCGKKNTGW